MSRLPPCCSSTSLPAGAAEGDEPRLDGGVLVVVEVAEQVLRAGPLGDHDIDRRLAHPERTAGDLDLGVLARETGEHGEGGAHRQRQRARSTVEQESSGIVSRSSLFIMEGEERGVRDRVCRRV